MDSGWDFIGSLIRPTNGIRRADSTSWPMLGDQTRDLGPFVERDVKYAWGSQGDDVMGYFHGHAAQRNLGLDQWDNQ